MIITLRIFCGVIIFLCLSGCSDKNANEHVDCFDVFVTSSNLTGKSTESKIATVQVESDDFYLSLAPHDTAIRLSRCSIDGEN